MGNRALGCTILFQKLRRVPDAFQLREKKETEKQRAKTLGNTIQKQAKLR
jgi:hypothetical protein